MMNASLSTATAVACLCALGCQSSTSSSSSVYGHPAAASTASAAHPAQVRSTPTLPFQLHVGTSEENSVTVCEFLAGSGFTPEERAVVQAEDAADRRRDPQHMAQADRQVRMILERVQRSTPLQEATTRELDAIFSRQTPLMDPRSMAIVASHNRVLAKNATSKTALTERSIEGILDEVQTMNAYQGRAALSSQALASFAAALPQEYAAASGNKQVLMANAESQAIALHTILNRFTAADRTRYQQTASGGPVTPEQLEEAAEATLLKADAKAAAQRKSDAAFFRKEQGLINEQFRIGISPLLPH